MKKDKLHYIFIPAAVFAVAVIGSALTSTGMGGWYETINLPAWTPAGGTIGMVWTAIFILTAVSLIIFWNRADHGTKRFRWTVCGFVINGVLNVSWSFLFFNQHLIGFAVIDALILAISVGVLICWMWPVSRTSSLLLLPYLGWSAFATYLNYTIYLLN